MLIDALAAALSEATTDGADPVTWVQALGVGGGAVVLAGLLVWLLRLIMRSGKEAREDNTRLDKQIAAQDKELDRLRKELDEERGKRFSAEDREHAANLELSRLQRALAECRGEQ